MTNEGIYNERQKATITWLRNMKVLGHYIDTNWMNLLGNTPIDPNAIVRVVQDMAALNYLDIIKHPKNATEFHHDDKDICNAFIGSGVQVVPTLTKTRTQNKETRYVIEMGNYAFPITLEQLRALRQEKPDEVLLVIQGNFALSNPTSTDRTHKDAQEMKEIVEDLGLYEIVHIDIGYFEQWKADAQKMKPATVVSALIKCKKGYTGDVTIKNTTNSIQHIVKRGSPIYARTPWGQKCADYPTKIDIDAIGDLKPFWIRPESGLEPVRVKKQRKSINDASKMYCVAMIEYSGGSPDEYGAQYSLATSEKRDPGDELLKGQYHWAFDNKDERDSLYSLFKSIKVNQAFMDINFKRGRMSHPGMKNLPNWPLDRIWTEKEVEDFV